MNIPLDLIGGISPYHMLDRFFTPWMVRKPCVHLEDILVNNDNISAASNETLYFSPSEDPRLSLGLRGHVCGVERGVQGFRRVARILPLQEKGRQQRISIQSTIHSTV
jgi:hypothetical protein